MRNEREKVELLAPAGSFEKLETAIHYGADAVYLAGKRFSLRSFAENFSDDELIEAVSLANRNGVKVYLALNIFPRNAQLPEIEDYLGFIGMEVHPDAIIASDPAVIMAARTIVPEIPLHLSTQANTTNIGAVDFWHGMGVKRVNLARELSLSEVSEIAHATEAEIEVFVHGAMCISYSGRCLLSNFLTLRGGNSGECTQSCRFSYEVVEEKRPGEYWPVVEDEHGTHIFNSRDLCMIEHVPALIESGVSSFKIEGRMKGLNYVASTIRCYRQAIDRYFENPQCYRTDPAWLDELSRVSHRDYCTGFYFGEPRETSINYYNATPAGVRTFVGKIIQDMGGGWYIVQVRNRIFRNDSVHLIQKSGELQQQKVNEIVGEKYLYLESVHANDYALMRLDSAGFLPGDLIQSC